MKVVFFHDHRFKKYNNKHYSEGQFSDSTWQRYLDFSDELLVVAREVEYTGINTEKLNAINNQRVLFDCFDEIKLFDRVINCQLKTNIAKKIEYTDVVVCRLPSFLGSLAFDVAFDLKKKIIVEVVGCPYDSLMNHGSFIAKLLAPLEAYKMKRIIKKSKNTLYVTSQFLQNRYPSDGLIVNASNVELPKIGTKVETSSGIKVIKFIGSLKAKYKGLQDLIVALGVLKKQGIVLQLDILGSGDREFFKALVIKHNVQNEVLFSKPISGGAEVIRWLSKGHLYIQPSHTEGLPRALIEAMSIGLPCIGTRIGGIPELLDERALVDKKSPYQIATLIEKFANDQAFRCEMAKLNFEKAKNYRFDFLQQKRNRFYQEVLKS